LAESRGIGVIRRSVQRRIEQLNKATPFRLSRLTDADRVEVGQVWFNGYDHLMDVDLEAFDERDGERLISLLLDQHPAAVLVNR
jgi:hypothetical protein